MLYQAYVLVDIRPDQAAHEDVAHDVAAIINGRLATIVYQDSTSPLSVATQLIHQSGYSACLIAKARRIGEREASIIERIGRAQKEAKWADQRWSEREKNRISA